MKSNIFLTLLVTIAMMAICPAQMWGLDGTGAHDTPYVIRNANDWYALTETEMWNGDETIYIAVHADFTVTKTLRKDDDFINVHVWGNGHTITLDIDDEGKENSGLFSKLGSSWIENLKINGKITSSKKHIGSICGIVKSPTFKNIISSATVKSTVDGDATAGGLVAEIANNGKVTFKQCGFTGKLDGSGKADKMCGMVGFIDLGGYLSKADFENCFTNATFYDVKSGDNYAFMRNDKNNYSSLVDYMAAYTTYTNCYYVNYGPGGKATDKEEDGPTQISEEEVANGTLAYRLNGSSDAVARWYHNIDNGNTDSYPYPFEQSGTLHHGLVYYKQFHENTTAKPTNYSHTITHYPAVEPICDEDGHVEYWLCNHPNATKCSDALATQTINEEDIVLPAVGHLFEDRYDPNHTLCLRSFCHHGFIHYTAKDTIDIRPESYGQFCNDVADPLHNHTFADGNGVIELKAPVVNIADSTFCSTDLQSMIIPITVQSIGKDAFGGCTSLETLEFCSVPAMRSIGEGLTTEYVFNLTDYSYVSTDDTIVYQPLKEVPTFTHMVAEDSQWGTVVLPFATSTTDDVQLYELIDISNDHVTLSPLQDLEANVPCVYKMKNAEADSVIFRANGWTMAQWIPAHPAASTVDRYALTGTYTKEELDEGHGYIVEGDRLENIDNLRSQGSVYCLPFQAWLKPDDASELEIDEAPNSGTGLDVLELLNAGDAAYYDLSGQRIYELQTGVNIVRRGNKTCKVILTQGR